MLFIAVDDLNDWVGCMGGHPDTQTPNIDNLAAEGMLFTNAHCAAPLCSPSRIAIATGLHPTSIKYIETYHKDLWIIQDMYGFQGLRLGGDQKGDPGNFSFMQTHIKGHGAMNDYIALLKGGQVKMGDTPTVLYMLKGTPGDPTKPSWGGRFQKREGDEYPNWYVNLKDPEYMVYEKRSWNSEWWGSG